MTIGARSLLGAIAFLVVGTTAVTAEPLTLVGPDFPPFYTGRADGGMGGALPALFRRIAAHAGVSWRPAGVMPTERAIRALAEGGASVSVLVENPILTASANITRSAAPVGELTLNFYGQGAMVWPSSLSRRDFENARIGVRRGYGYGGLRSWLDEPANAVKLKIVDTDGELLAALIEGKIDGALMYVQNFENAVIEIGEWPSDFTVHEVERVPLFVFINHAVTPGAQAIMDRLDASFASLSRRGELAPVGDPRGVE